MSQSTVPKTSPNPDWSIDSENKNQPHPFENAEHIAINPKEIESNYFLTISGVIPRPIAFVSTLSVS
jgi:hypothetical protein